MRLPEGILRKCVLNSSTPNDTTVSDMTDVTAWRAERIFGSVLSDSIAAYSLTFLSVHVFSFHKVAGHCIEDKALQAPQQLVLTYLMK